jgi:hypothetical protein
VVQPETEALGEAYRYQRRTVAQEVQRAAMAAMAVRSP